MAKVLVVGAGGKTGKLVVERALAAGHTVTAFLHAHENGEDHDTVAFPAAVEVIHGDARNPSRLDTAMNGRDVAIDCIGVSKPFLKTDLEAETARALVDGMERNGVKRLLAISAVGVGDSGPGGEHQTGPWMYEHLLVPTYLRGTVKDKAHMEEEVERSGYEWVIVRPPVLNDHETTGAVRVIGEGEIAHRLTRGDLAQFLVDQITGYAHVGQVVTIANT